jgi:hypothetical protein
MSKCDQTVEELADSLTGFDEIAIKKAFGVPFATLAPDEKGKGGDVFQFLRSLVYVHCRRDGENDVTAYNTAQGMTTSEVNSYFADESAESGKDNSQTEERPTTSPPGVSTPDSLQPPGSN